MNDKVALDSALILTVCERLYKAGVSAAEISKIRRILDEQRLMELHDRDLEQLCLLKESAHSEAYNEEADVSSLCRILLFDSESIPSRRDLWKRIAAVLPPGLIPDPDRLLVLLDQARKYQELHCVCHDGGTGSWSPFEDHFCDPAKTSPSLAIGRLDGHRDEVWSVAISGSQLASASKDRSICVWDLVFFQPVAVLNGQTEPCTCLAWSADGTQILSGSNDCAIRLWRPSAASTLVRVFEHHKEPVSGLAWLAAHRFLSASTDKSVVLWNVNGQILTVWAFAGRVTDIALIAASGVLAVAASERKVALIPITNEAEWHTEPIALTESHPVVSLAASSFRNELLVLSSRNPPVVHLWDTQGRRIAQTYRGHTQGKFSLRPAFAGSDEQFVVSGSEDGRIFLWNRLYGCVVSSFDAHAGSVNAVGWSQALEALISCSDDRTIKVWTNQRVREARRSRSDSTFTDT